MKVERLEIEQVENGFLVYARWQELTNRFVARDWLEVQDLISTVEWIRRDSMNVGRIPDPVETGR